MSSLVAGLAQSAATLLIARAIQGAGAALIAPAALSMVMALFAARPAELRKALGFWGASAAAGGTAGVFLGGVITEWLSWRWTFLVNAPVGAPLGRLQRCRGDRRRRRRHRGARHPHPAACASAGSARARRSASVPDV